MPTILHVNVAKNSGSTGRIADQLSLFAQSKGWESYVAHGSRYNLDGGAKGIIVSRPFAEYLHFFISLLTDGQGFGSIKGTKDLVRWIEEKKPDIIHLHNIHGYYINYPILFRYLSANHIPVIWTLHDCWPFTGHCTYFDIIGCEKWETGCSNCPQVSSYPRSLIDRSKRNYKKKQQLFTSVSNMIIVPVSEWLHGLVSKSFLSKYPIRTIHNGIDLNIFYPSESGFRKRNALEGKFVILGVADGYGKRKGLSDFNTLSARFGSEVKIVLVGLSESDRKSVSSNILGIGHTTNRQELVDIYSTADVYVNPTREDNFPTTNIEALACGTPVITYRTGGSSEAIDDLSGIVVEKGDVEGLVRAIETVKRKGKSYYSKACRKRAESNFNKEDRSEDYVRLYEEIISQGI